MRAKITRAIILCLLAAAGTPMPESALVRAVRKFLPIEDPTFSDITDALKDVDEKKLAAGVTDPDGIEERSWTLTLKGTHKARALR